MQESLGGGDESVVAGAAALVCTLLSARRDEAAPALLALLQQQCAAPAQSLAAALGAQAAQAASLPAGQPLPCTALGHALDADAVMHALGVCAYDMHDCLRFDDWCRAALLPLLAATPPPELASAVAAAAGAAAARAGSGDGGAALALSVLRRRSLWLLRCWMADLTDELRPALLEQLGRLLSGGGEASVDPGVRLSAIAAVQALVDDMAFKPAMLLPTLRPMLDGLWAAASALRSLEARQQVVRPLARD